MYQGHTHSRTNSFLKEYVKSLKKADEVYIMPTFSSVRESGNNDHVLLDACNKMLEQKGMLAIVLKNTKKML